MTKSKSIQIGLVPEFHADGVTKIPGFGLCIYQLENDLVRLVRINIKKNLGSDVIYGDIAILSEGEFSKFHGKSKFKDERQPASLTVCPLMNFPQLMRYAYIENGKPNKTWINMVQALFAALPNCMKGVDFLFETDFAQLQPMERIPIFVRHLKSLVNFDGIKPLA